MSNALLLRFHLFIFRFRPINVKEMIHVVLGEMLSGKTYNSEETASWTRDISDTIKKRLKGMQCLKKKVIIYGLCCCFFFPLYRGKVCKLKNK